MTTTIDFVPSSGTDGPPDLLTALSQLAARNPQAAARIPCRQGDPDLWFAEQAHDIEQAKAACAPCALREMCLAAAIAREEPWGVWGGEVFVDGRVVERKRGRGRPRKIQAA